MIGAFGVELGEDLSKGLADKAQHEYDEHPVASSVAAGAVALAAHKGARVVPAMRFARSVGGNTTRAARLSRDLVPHKSASSEGALNMLEVKARQAKVHAGARAANPDIGRLQPTAERYSSRMDVARGVREASNSPNQYRGAQAVLHPRKAEHALHARNIASVIDSAEHGAHPSLFRSQHIVAHHKVGDTVDFGRVSSWTSSKDFAEMHGKNLAQVHASGAPGSKKLLPPGANTHAIYHLPEGTTKAANISGAVKGFTQNEWLTGGQYKVIGAQVSRDGTHHYRLGPHHGPIAKSAFGVEL